MKEYLRQLGNEIYKTVRPYIGSREILGRAADGDIHFKLDEVAERGMEAALEGLSREGLKIAYFSEKDGELEYLNRNPEYIFLIDPVDGSRPASCGFPCWCVNIAVAPYSERPIVGDVQYAFMKEADGTEYLAERGKGATIIIDGTPHEVKPSEKTELEGSSLILEFCGNEQTIAGLIYAPLLAKAWPTGVSVVSSGSWSIGQLARGKVDGYIHLAKRIYEEFPEYRENILQANRGKLKAQFPYDIAPPVLIGEESGLTMTDTRGNSHNNMSLIDISPENQRCTIAAGTEEIHGILKDTVNERIAWLKSKPHILNELISD